MKAELMRMRTDIIMTKFASTDVPRMRIYRKPEDNLKGEDEAMQGSQLTRRNLTPMLLQEAAKQQEARRSKGLQLSEDELTACKFARSRKTNRGVYNDRCIQGISGKMNLKIKAVERSALLRILNAK